MKKIFFVFAFLSILGFSFTACEKNEVAAEKDKITTQAADTRSGGQWCNYYTFTLNHVGYDENGCCIFQLTQHNPNGTGIGDVVIVTSPATLLNYTVSGNTAYYKYKVCQGKKFVATVWGWNSAAQSYSDWCQSFLMSCI